MTSEHTAAYAAAVVRHHRPDADAPEPTLSTVYGVRFGDGVVNEAESRADAEAEAADYEAEIDAGRFDADDYRPMIVVSCQERAYDLAVRTPWEPVQ